METEYTDYRIRDNHVSPPNKQDRHRQPMDKHALVERQNKVHLVHVACQFVFVKEFSGKIWYTDLQTMVFQSVSAEYCFHSKARHQVNGRVTFLDSESIPPPIAMPAGYFAFAQIRNEEYCNIRVNYCKMLTQKFNFMVTYAEKLCTICKVYVALLYV